MTIGDPVDAVAMQEGIHTAAANRGAAHRKTCQQESAPGTNIARGNVNATQTGPAARESRACPERVQGREADL